FFGPLQSCSRSCSIIAVSTCWPASRQRPKNAVRVSARTSSNGSGSCTVTTGGEASTSPANVPVRLFFIGGSLLRVVVTTVLPDGRRSCRSFFSPSVQKAPGHPHRPKTLGQQGVSAVVLKKKQRGPPEP